MRAILDLSVKANNVRLFSGNPYHEFSFQNVRPEPAVMD